MRHNNELYFDSVATANDFPQHIHAKPGAILEESSFATEAMEQICRCINGLDGGFGGAALIIDYGYCIEPKYRSANQYTSTLQAVKEHKFHPVLLSYYFI